MRKSYTILPFGIERFHGQLAERSEYEEGVLDKQVVGRQRMVTNIFCQFWRMPVIVLTVKIFTEQMNQLRQPRLDTR